MNVLTITIGGTLIFLFAERELSIFGMQIIKVFFSVKFLSFKIGRTTECEY
jgi:hypothetical protein